MQTSLIDKKLSVIFDKYRDRDYAANAQKEVEAIRRRALTVGATTTGAAFVLNEVARLSLRSRKCLPSRDSYSDLQTESPEHPLLASCPDRREQGLLRLPHPREDRQPLACAPEPR